MNDDERAEAVLMIHRLRLAAWDMDRAHTAAICIPNPAYRGIRELLETAMAVIYARTFTPSDAHLNLGKSWRPETPPERRLHTQLLALRRKVYAHTDDTDWRKVANVGSIIPGAEHLHGVWSASMPDDWVAEVAAMTERQRDRFMREARAREQDIGGATK